MLRGPLRGKDWLCWAPLQKELAQRVVGEQQARLGTDFALQEADWRGPGEKKGNSSLVSFSKERFSQEIRM